MQLLDELFASEQALEVFEDLTFGQLKALSAVEACFLFPHPSCHRRAIQFASGVERSPCDCSLPSSA